jgi:hypothetical protein
MYQFSILNKNDTGVSLDGDFAGQFGSPLHGSQ